MRILLVEDDFATLSFLETLLQGRGHKVMACDNGESAWEVFQKNYFDVVLLDVGLPGIDGLELCRMMRKLPRGDEGVILILTAYRESATLEVALAAGADDYLVKPFDTEFLDVRFRIAEQWVKIHRARTRAEEALKESKDQLQAFIAASPDSVFIVDEDGKYLDILTVQYPGADKLKGKYFHDILPQKDADKLLNSVHQAIETKELKTVEYQHGQYSFEGRTSPLPESSCEKKKVIWIARNLSK